MSEEKIPNRRFVTNSRQEREELNALSKKVFKASSRWQKWVTNGIPEPMEREREVTMVRGGKLVKKVFKDTKYVVKHFSIDEIRTFMENVLKEHAEALKATEPVVAVENKTPEPDPTLLVNPAALEALEEIIK